MSRVRWDAQKKNSGSESKEAKKIPLSPFSPSTTLPLQTHYQAIVDDLYAKTQESKAFEKPIHVKYGIHQYHLFNIEGEPVEVLVYHKDSQPYPLIEVQARKRMEDLIHATRAVLENEGRDEKDALTQLQDRFNEQIDQLLKKPISNNKDFDTQFKEADKLVNQAVDTLAFIWAENHPNHLTLTKNDYIAFFKNLANASDTGTVPYATYQIMTINDDPAVNTVQYNARGTKIAPEGQGQEGRPPGAKQFQSSHSRGTVGIPNFTIAVSGYIDSRGERPRAIISSPGDFSHASFPAYDYYKKEGKEEKQKYEKEKKRQKTHEHSNYSQTGYYSPESISITTEDMLLLEKEIRAEIAPEEKPEEEKGEGETTAPLTWINVGLLTVINDKEHQDRIYQETILAADRLRSRDNSSIIPITFNFGVNFAASKTSGVHWGTSRLVHTYPPEQQLENQRAFFHLQGKILESLRPVIDDLKKAGKLGEDSPLNTLSMLYESYSILSKHIDNFNFIEGQIKIAAQEYDRAMNNFKLNSSDENRKAIMAAEKELNRIKGLFLESASTHIANYTAAYEKIATELKANVKFLQDYNFSEPGRSVVAVMQDFEQVIDLFRNNRWNTDDNNFKLQARISHLGEHLEVVNHYFPPNGKPAHTASSFNCKSRDDRSLVQAVIKDQLRAELDNIALDTAKHARSSASNYIPPQDTRGGGAKFGGKVKGGVRFDPLGHPDPDFARRQEKTAKWSTKKLFSKILKSLKEDNKVYNPKPQLISPHSLQKKNQTAILEQYEKTFNDCLINIVGKTFPLDAGKDKDMKDMLEDKHLFESHVNILKNMIIQKNAPTNLPSFTTHVIQQFLQHTNEFKNANFYDPAPGLIQTLITQYLIAIHPPEKKLDENIPPVASVSLLALQQKTATLEEQVSAFEGWKKAIQRPMFSFENMKLFHTDSTDTQNVTDAYQAWDESDKKGDPLLTQNDKLHLLEKAVDKWITKKQGGSQFTKENQLRGNSRLPAMLALQKCVQENINKKNEEIYKEFLNGTLSSSEGYRLENK